MQEINKIHTILELRDYFAARAMQGIINNPTHYIRVSMGAEPRGKQIAGEAYAIADAMLRKREADNAKNVT